MKDILIIITFILVIFSPALYQLFFLLKESENEAKKILLKLKKYVLYSILILIPFLILFLTLNRINFLNYKKPMPFSEIKNVSFEDFRGFEFFKKTLYGSKRFAYIVTSIEVQIEKEEAIIESYFHPSRSYVYNTHSNSKELFKHEIYHFKITEIFARKIKKYITKENLEDIIQQQKKAEREYQRKYDYDTFHSYVYQEQKKYEREIDSILLSLEEFKNPKITLNVTN